MIRIGPISLKATIAYAQDCQVCSLCEDGCSAQSISLNHDISNTRRFSTYDQFGLDI